MNPAVEKVIDDDDFGFNTVGKTFLPGYAAMFDIALQLS